MPGPFVYAVCCYASEFDYIGDRHICIGKDLRVVSLHRRRARAVQAAREIGNTMWSDRYGFIKKIRATQGIEQAEREVQAYLDRTLREMRRQ